MLLQLRKARAHRSELIVHTSGPTSQTKKMTKVRRELEGERGQKNLRACRHLMTRENMGPNGTESQVVKANGPKASIPQLWKCRRLEA